MAKKDLSKVDFNQAKDSAIGQAKTFGVTKGEETIIKDDNIPEPRGAGQAVRQVVYLFRRDLKLLKKYQNELKNEHGKVTLSEIIRFAINTINIKHFHRGF